MKTGDIFSGILGALGKTGSWASYAHTMGALLDTFRGGGLPADAGDAVKGLHGVFGKGDEREFQVLLIQLENWKDGSRALVEDFLAWHFQGSTSLEKTLAWWHLNSFRAFVTKMGSAPKPNLNAEKFKVETLKIRNTKTGRTTVRTTTPITHEGSNNSLEFLKWMATTIRSETDRKKGHQKVVGAFRTGNVPHMPSTMISTLQRIGGDATLWSQNFSDELRRFAEQTTAAVDRRRKRPKSFLWRLLIEWKL